MVYIIDLLKGNPGPTGATGPAGGITKGITDTFTAGESLTAGNICYLKNADNKMYKAKADSSSTSSTLLAIAKSNISSNATGEFTIFGVHSTSSLSAGKIYYLSAATAGIMTDTIPSGSGDIVRILGYAISSTQLHFAPETTYIELG